MRRRLVLGAVAIALGATPATASAALGFQPCVDPPGVQCAHIDVSGTVRPSGVVVLKVKGKRLRFRPRSLQRRTIARQLGNDG